MLFYFYFLSLHVLGIIFIVLVCFVVFFFSMFKDRALFTMYQHVCIWKYYDMVVSIVGFNCSQP